MKYISLIIVSILLAANLKAQGDLQIQLNYANSLYRSGQYYDAITEYKRLLFFDLSNEFDRSYKFDTTKTYLFIGNFNIGKCYKAGAKLDDAIKYFSKSEINAANVEEKYRAKIEIVKSNILRRTTERAIQILDEVENNHEFNEKIDSIDYWRGWTYIFKDDWEKAHYYFNKFQPNHELKKLSEQVLKDKYSVTFAKVISYILPGAGQIYTGNILSGLMSLGYNVLFGYLTAKSFADNRAFDGLVIGSLLWLRFYRGNIQNAEKFAVEKNKAISNKALDYLQYEYKGDKP